MVQNIWLLYLSPKIRTGQSAYAGIILKINAFGSMFIIEMLSTIYVLFGPVFFFFFSGLVSLKSNFEDCYLYLVGLHTYYNVWVPNAFALPIAEFGDIHAAWRTKNLFALLTVFRCLLIPKC